MYSLLMTAALLGAAPDAPAPPDAADAVVSAAFRDDLGTKTEALKSDAPNLVVPGLALAALAGLAFALKRRKQLKVGGASINIVEAASLGEKRSLVIADVLGERLVLGVSEAGVTVLMTRPAPEEGEEAPIVLPPAPGSQMGFFARLRGNPKTPAFDAALQESLEDQELRAKLQAGVRSVVP